MKSTMPQRRLAEVAVVLAVAISLIGCQPAARPGDRLLMRANSCSIRPRNPHRSSGTPRDIVAKAEMGCDHPVARLTYYLWLQKKHASGWGTIESRVGSLVGAQAPVSRPIIRQVAVACSTGRFRLVVQIKATQDGETKVGGKSYSSEVANPCAGASGGSAGSW